MTEKSTVLRDIDKSFECNGQDKKKSAFFTETIYRMRKLIPSIEQDFLAVETAIKPQNNRDKYTTLIWRNILSQDLPLIFHNPHNPPSTKKNDRTIPYMHVGNYVPLHKDEEHNNTSLEDLELNRIFYKRLHHAVRFSRNALEHLKDKEGSVKRIYLDSFLDREEFEHVDEENEAIEFFSFCHPGLNWILPVFWEINYRDNMSSKIATKIEEYRLKNWSVYKLK